MLPEGVLAATKTRGLDDGESLEAALVPQDAAWGRGSLSKIF